MCQTRSEVTKESKLLASRAKVCNDLTSAYKSLAEAIAAKSRKAKVETILAKCTNLFTSAIAKNDQLLTLAGKTDGVNAAAALEQWCHEANVAHELQVKEAHLYLTVAKQSKSDLHEANSGRSSRNSSKRSSVSHPASMTPSEKQRQLLISQLRLQEIQRQAETAQQLAEEKHQLKMKSLAEDSRQRIVKAQLEQLELTDTISQHPSLPPLEGENDIAESSQRVNEWVNTISQSNGNEEPPESYFVPQGGQEQHNSVSHVGSLTFVPGVVPSFDIPVLYGDQNIIFGPTSSSGMNEPFPTTSGHLGPQLPPGFTDPNTFGFPNGLPPTAAFPPPVLPFFDSSSAVVSSGAPASVAFSSSAPLPVFPPSAVVSSVAPASVAPSSSALLPVFPPSAVVSSVAPSVTFSSSPCPPILPSSSAPRFATPLLSSRLHPHQAAIRFGGPQVVHSGFSQTGHTASNVPNSAHAYPQPVCGGMSLPGNPAPSAQSLPLQPVDTVTRQDLADLIAASRKDPLPEWKLSQFSGDALHWHEWIGQFRSAIDSQKLSDDVKLTYLKTLVTGKAKSAISEFAYCGTMY